MDHEEFAKRAQRRLEAVADRLEDEGRRLGIDGEASKTTARAKELRVAALLVREEATAARGGSPRRKSSPQTRPWKRRVRDFRNETASRGRRAVRTAEREAAKCP